MKIAIIDRDEFYRNYLGMILPLLEGVTEVKQFEFDDEVLPKVHAFSPDVVIFDPCHENKVELGFFGKLIASQPNATLVGFLELENEIHGETLYRLGVSNVLSKSSGTEYLRYILRQLLKQAGPTQASNESALEKMASSGKQIPLVHKGLKPLRAPSPHMSQKHPAAQSRRSSFGAMSTIELEPTAEESQALKELHVRLFRKQQDKLAPHADHHASSFTSIWKLRNEEAEHGHGRHKKPVRP